ncbi:MAG: hypothetical protein ACK5JD_06100 [Mangrovibacterium sp.]
MTSEELHNYLANPELLDADTLPQLEALVQRYPSFQLGWMLLLKNMKLLNLPGFETTLAKGAFFIVDRRRLYYFLQDQIARDHAQAERELNALSGEYPAAASYQLDAGPEQLDTLADLARSLRRKQAQTDGNEEQNEQPETAPEFVTETLAKIYIRQGMYKQAILAYEKLSLKYPEKNIYFAGQIDEVKQLMN